MEAKTHTPGPWGIAEYGQRANGSPLHFGIVVGEKTIANLGTSTRNNATEIEQNARLIAAAPDLLAACKAMLARWQQLYPHDHVGPQSLAIRAIAKAERE